MNEITIKKLKKGEIGVLPTDTIYGVVGTALKQETAERLYKVRKRNPDKPFLILISSTKDLKRFFVDTSKAKKYFEEFWPGKVTLVLPLLKEGISKFKFLHRGKNTLGFRLPKSQKLLELLKKTGPLLAPSANPEGLAPAQTIKEARGYFGDTVDFYISGKTSKKPSKIVAIDTNGNIHVIRD